MVREVIINHTYKFPFDFVQKTYFDKYTDGRDPLVKNVEVLERRVDEQGVEHVKRTAEMENIAPSFAQVLLGNVRCKMEEVVSIDTMRRTFQTYTRNITWADFAVLQERSVYTVHAEDASWTHVDQKGTIECVKCPPIIGPLLERFTQHVLQAGALNGLKIMDALLEERWREQHPKKAPEAPGA